MGILKNGRSNFEMIRIALLKPNIKIEVDKDIVTLHYKNWDGYKSLSAFHSIDFNGFGYVSLHELKEKLIDYTKQ